MSVYTVGQMSDIELVATVLGVAPEKEVCGRIATAMTSEGWLSGAPLVEVASESGSVGERRIARLEASVELGRRALAARASRKGTVISTPEDAAAVIRPLVAGQDREHFYALALNTKNMLLKVIEVSVGSLNASIVHPRELFREAIAVSAASIVVIVVHNHPSGDPSPSGADIQLTRRLVEAGNVLGIEVLDHVVIGGDGHCSLRDMSLM